MYTTNGTKGMGTQTQCETEKGIDDTLSRPLILNDCKDRNEPKRQENKT